MSPGRTTRSSTKTPVCKVRDLIDAMERIAPTALAQDWDNVGLLVGDGGAPLRRVLLCIDLTPEVAREASAGKHDLVLAYHPPIFKPMSRIRADADDTSAIVHHCIRSGISIYSPHTALDAADGGTNDVLAALCGARDVTPLEFAQKPGPPKCKLVVFAPADEADNVATAMFDAGAGNIGDYSGCSFRLPGEGTFLGGEGTNPAVGKRGRFERVGETRIEVVLSTRELPGVVAAMRRAHSYEEPAFDIYALKPPPTPGIGRVGSLPRPVTLKGLARKLKRSLENPPALIVGDGEANIERVIVVVGSAGSLPFKLPLGPGDAIVTGEMRHHDALTARRKGCAVIALGHQSSERPVLAPLAARLTDALPGCIFAISKADVEPFAMA